jgi:P-type E1-E2 ATPase
VLAVAMTRDGVEDYFRYKSDVLSNGSTTNVYRLGKFVETTFKDIFVGEVVMVKCDETFPCDLILLNSNNENGVAYIETASLDGEKNLKPRQPQFFSAGLYSPEKPIRLLARVNCENPNPKFDIYNGSIEFDGGAVSLDKR